MKPQQQNTSFPFYTCACWCVCVSVGDRGVCWGRGEPLHYTSIKGSVVITAAAGSLTSRLHYLVPFVSSRCSDSSTQIVSFHFGPAQKCASYWEPLRREGFFFMAFLLLLLLHLLLPPAAPLSYWEVFHEQLGPTRPEVSERGALCIIQ